MVKNKLVDFGFWLGVFWFFWYAGEMAGKNSNWLKFSYMAKNTQEYLNGLVNKPRLFYLDLSNHTETQTCSQCNQRSRSCQKALEGEITDLKDFPNLKSLNASNHGLTSLDFLNSLVNKDKLEKLNLFGNQIASINFAVLFTDFPNLQVINLDNNPLKGDNLEGLNNQQLTKLVGMIIEGKMRVSSYKGTFLMDLLKYIQGNSGVNQTTTFHLQSLVQGKTKQEKPITNNNLVNGENNPNSNSNIVFYLITGLILLISSVLAIGYWLGKKRNKE